MHEVIYNHQLAVIPNFYVGAFECDMFVLNKNLYTTEYEVKRSKADFNNDFKKARTVYGWRDQVTKSHTTKHDLIKDGKRTNRFIFVVEAGIEVDIPDYAGYMTFEIKNNWINFRHIKGAPRLHNRKADDKMVVNCLKNLSWRHYQLTRNVKEVK